MGRFINADSLTSTGQGFLGNNMFAYCNNNPTIYQDKSGTYVRDAIASIYVDTPGNDIWYCPVGTENPSEFAQKIDTFIFDFVEANSIEDYINWYNDFKEFEEIANPVAVIQISSGYKKIYRGMELLAAPIPTPADEIVGIVYILWGGFSISSRIIEIYD